MQRENKYASIFDTMMARNNPDQYRKDQMYRQSVQPSTQPSVDPLAGGGTNSQTQNQDVAPTIKPNPISKIVPPTQPKTAEIRQQNTNNAQQQQQQQQQPTFTPPVPPRQTSTSPQVGFQIGNVGSNQIGQYAQESTNFILEQYDRKMADTKFQELQATHGVTGVQEAIEDIEKVKGAVQSGAFDAQSISQATGLNAQRVDEIMQGKAFRSIQLPDHLTEDFRKSFEFQTRDLDTTYNRNKEQYDIRKERASVNYNWTMDDIRQQAGQDIAKARFLGAATGMGQSDGFIQAVELIREKGNDNLERLTTRFDRENEDISRAKMQLLEDYEHNTEKMKYYFDKGMDDMRSQTLIQVQQIQAKYGVNTTEMTDALKSLYLDVDRMKIDHLNQTMSLQQSYNKMYSDEIDRMYDYQTEARQNYADLASNGQQGLASALYPGVNEKVEYANFQGKDLNVDVTQNQAIIEANAGQARAKNNNPSGITYTNSSEGLRQARTDAGVQFEDGSNRPANEGGSYVKFSTLADGFEAQWIALSRNGGNVGARLKARVGTAEGNRYAQQVLGYAGLDASTNFEDMTADDKQRLQLALARKESPGLYSALTSENSFLEQGKGGNQNFSSEAIQYAEAIMSPSSNMKLSELPSKYRAETGAYLNQLKNEAESTGDTYGMMLASAGGDKPEATFLQQLNKGYSVVGQLDNLNRALGDKDGGGLLDQKTNEGLDLSPFTGWLRKKNPRDTDAQEIQASLTALTPMLARGIYGEVGVLTDNDIRLYQQTIPNLSQTQDVKKAVLGLTLRTVRNGLEEQMIALAGSGRDVSGMADRFKKLNDKIKEIDKSIGINEYGVEDIDAIIDGGETNVGAGSSVTDDYLSDLGF